MAENDVTLGEVYRLILSMDKRLSESLSKVIGRDEYESDQEGIAHKFQESGKVHAALEAKVAAVDAKVDSKVAALEAKVEAQEKEQRSARSKWILALVIAAVGPLLAFIVNLIARGVLG